MQAAASFRAALLLLLLLLMLGIGILEGVSAEDMRFAYLRRARALSTAERAHALDSVGRYYSVATESDDTPLDPVPLQFPFPVLGQVVYTAFIDPNGGVQFTAGAKCTCCYCTTLDTKIFNTLTGVYSDQNPFANNVRTQGGTAYIAFNSSTSVLEVLFHDLQFWANSPSDENPFNTFLLRLYPSGKFAIDYVDIEWPDPADEPAYIFADAVHGFLSGLRERSDRTGFIPSSTDTQARMLWNTTVAGVYPMPEDVATNVSFEACPVSSDWCMLPTMGPSEGGFDIQLSTLWYGCPVDEYELFCRFGNDSHFALSAANVSVVSEVVSVGTGSANASTSANVSTLLAADGLPRTRPTATVTCTVPASPLGHAWEAPVTVWFRGTTTNDTGGANGTTATDDDNELDIDTGNLTQIPIEELTLSYQDAPVVRFGCDATYESTYVYPTSDEETCGRCALCNGQSNCTSLNCSELLPYERQDCAGGCGNTRIFADVRSTVDRCCNETELDCRGYCKSGKPWITAYHASNDWLVCCKSTTVDCANVCGGSATENGQGDCSETVREIPTQDLITGTRRRERRRLDGMFTRANPFVKPFPEVDEEDASDGGGTMEQGKENMEEL